MEIEPCRLKLTKKDTKIMMFGQDKQGDFLRGLGDIKTKKKGLGKAKKG